MARKANIDNLIRDAKKADERIAEIEKLLKTAKADSAGAWDKVSVRKNELEQENNNGLAKEIKSFFGEDITPAELNKQLSELLLIDEVREYIESEKLKRKAAAEKKAEEGAEKEVTTESNFEDNAVDDTDCIDNNASDSTDNNIDSNIDLSADAANDIVRTDNISDKNDDRIR